MSREYAGEVVGTAAAPGSRLAEQQAVSTGRERHRPPAKRRRTNARRTSLLAHGQPMMFLTGGALAVCLAMILGLIVLIVLQGFATFWPGPVVRLTTFDGRTLIGEVTRDEKYRPAEHVFDSIPEDRRAAARARVDDAEGVAQRRLLRTGNFELTSEHFNWVSDFETATEDRPEWAVVVERKAWGRFYGMPSAFLIDGEPVESATSPGEVWNLYRQHHDAARARWEVRHRLETKDIGEINRRQEGARLAARRAEREHGADSIEHEAALRAFETVRADAEVEFGRIQAEMAALDAENARYQLIMTTADGQTQTLALADVVRAYPANQLTWAERSGLYLSRWWEFLADEPREANTEGGVFPAIFGTVMMTLIMSFAVVPFGVLAALYLREYAKAGMIVSIVRISINNLAGVPSIVFGVFGLGFFCLFVGGAIDQGLYPEKAGPTFKTGGILWASLTLALLTLPVVIVATEEALAAVPGSMREGSYACGASKWQTIRRIVLPRAMPGIMTGMILAMARGAGEVAPLMLVGAVKWAPEMPFDGHFPFVHLERSFMHLGFHIYDLGFQSQNSEAAKPMVFTTTLLLIAIIACLNVTAVWLRGRFKRRFVGGAF